MDKLKAFLAETETFLNEIYERDLGVHFEVVKNEQLIIIEEAKTPSDRHNVNYIKNNGTEAFNKLIGVDNYDIGVWLSLSEAGENVLGQALIGYAYKEPKGSAVVLRKNTTVIAHEIGHLFGGIHTHSIIVGGYADPTSDNTEAGRGQSVMSAGAPRDFFSLSSIERIRKELAVTPYYKGKDRKELVPGNSNIKNIPRGILLTEEAPQIDKAQLKEEYLIPKNTFFQFKIPTLPTGKQLLYMGQQHDVRNKGQESIATFMCEKPSTEQPMFRTGYDHLAGAKVLKSFPEANETGEYTFWLGVSDAQPDSHTNYVPQYDLFETKVKVIDKTPFRLTNTMKKSYTGREKITLTWSVDNTVFDANSKVRITLSDDLGAHFKYVLKESVPNNGSCEVTLPNINIGKIDYGTIADKVAAGVIKIEVIGHIAMALTEYAPKVGGFTITPDPSKPQVLQWVRTPVNAQVECKGNVPAVGFRLLCRKTQTRALPD